MIETGKLAPDFTLIDHNGDEVTLSSYKNKKNVVLSFHILSFTGGWSHQVSLFRMNNSRFEEIDTQVLGIGTDSKPAQTAFATGLGGIPYPILSDFHPQGKVSDLFGVFNSDKGTPFRAVIIIDKNGVVRFSKTYESMAELVIDDLFDQVKIINTE